MAQSYKPTHMADANGDLYVMYINGKRYGRITIAQVKACIKHNGSWKGYVKGNIYNTMYEIPHYKEFTNESDLVEWVSDWNSYNNKDYGTLCYWTRY